MDGGLTLSSELVPLPQTPEELINVLRRVVAKPFVEKVTISAGRDIEVLWHKSQSDSLSVSADNLRSQQDVISSLSMSEVSREFNDASVSRELLFEAMETLSMEWVEPTHLLCGSIELFTKWLNMGKYCKFPSSGSGGYRFVGLEVVEVESLPDTVVLVCGAGASTNNLDEVSNCVKITMEFPKNER
jgi:hypothetical protein